MAAVVSCKSGFSTGQHKVPTIDTIGSDLVEEPEPFYHLRCCLPDMGRHGCELQLVVWGQRGLTHESWFVYVSYYCNEVLRQGPFETGLKTSVTVFSGTLAAVSRGFSAVKLIL